MEGPGPDSGWTPPFPDDAPLVVVSLGTTPMGEEGLLQRVLDALADQAVHVFTSVGAHVDAGALRVPENARVGGYVRHAAVLPHAAVLVTHAGLGSVIAGAAFGVPMVCLPLGREQPNNAARVTALGIGRTLDPDSAVAELRAAITDVLGSATIRDAARTLGARIGRDAGGQRAVAEVERLFTRV
jgi:MGT family glycosyltransferase